MVEALILFESIVNSQCEWPPVTQFKPSANTQGSSSHPSCVPPSQITPCPLTSRPARSPHQILFLNKVDVLAQKLRDPQQQISANFPDFTGQPESSTDAIEFFKRKFFGLNRNPEKQIYAYPTTATNSENIKVSSRGVACVEHRPG